MAVCTSLRCRLASSAAPAHRGRVRRVGPHLAWHRRDRVDGLGEESISSTRAVVKLDAIMGWMEAWEALTGGQRCAPFEHSRPGARP